MAAGDFHNKNFDDGTLTKLRIFELYAREWLPVFISRTNPPWAEIHIFDFFAGPGLDSAGELGSPLRLMKQLQEYQHLAGWPHVRVNAHFFDANANKINQLKASLEAPEFRVPSVELDVRPIEFHAALEDSTATLASRCAAKLVFIDQCGVDQVTPDVFRQLVNSPTCDFLFFISSSTLHRFRDHPAIKQKISRPEDHYHIHRTVLAFYRGLLPDRFEYYLAPYSIRKRANVYGLIFGSAHPLGMDKFLQVAWKQDEINGEADFDINRENISSGEMLLALDEFRPSKITAFERDLEHLLRSGEVKTEMDVVRVCFDHGVTRQHAEPVLTKLKKEKIILADFHIPQIDKQNGRSIRLLA